MMAAIPSWAARAHLQAVRWAISTISDYAKSWFEFGNSSSGPIRWPPAWGTYTMSAGCAGTAAIVATALDEMSAAELHVLLDREEQACTTLIYCAA